MMKKGNTYNSSATYCDFENIFTNVLTITHPTAGKTHEFA